MPSNELPPVLADLEVFGAYAATVQESELDDLRRKIETLPAIEQAKGILMGYYGISADAAFAVLRRWSMSNNLKLSTLCGTVVSEASQVSELPFERLRQAVTRWE